MAAHETDKPSLWSPSSPSLYRCEVRLEGAHGAHDVAVRFGLRSFEFVEHGPFRLNGERLLLRGTHRREDHAGRGAALTEDLIRKEFTLVKEMGVNFMRLGHYQQSRVALELCDELGILVWEEIPWCRGRPVPRRAQRRPLRPHRRRASPRQSRHLDGRAQGRDVQRPRAHRRRARRRGGRERFV